MLSVMTRDRSNGDLLMQSSAHTCVTIGKGDCMTVYLQTDGRWNSSSCGSLAQVGRLPLWG